MVKIANIKIFMVNIVNAELKHSQAQKTKLFKPSGYKNRQS